jgi:hypothetical protein
MAVCNITSRHLYILCQRGGEKIETCARESQQVCEDSKKVKWHCSKKIIVGTDKNLLNVYYLSAFGFTPILRWIVVIIPDRILTLYLEESDQ